MVRYDLPQALEMHGLLRQFVMNHVGGRPDEAARRTVNELCRRLLAAANDSTCKVATQRIEGLAANLYSADEHRNWDRPGQPGTAHLKQLVLHELIRLRLHLRRIEAAETCAQTVLNPTPFDPVDKRRAPSIH